jgi:hypothetical protein
MSWRERRPNRLFTMKELNLSNVAVVGGGRWGLVTCSVLQRLLPENVPIWLVSRHATADRIARGVAGLLISASYQIQIGPEQRSSQRLRTIMRKPR